MDLPRLNMDDEQPKMVLMLLPDSLLDHILQYCDSSSLRACAAVNKGLSKLANESQLWRQLYFSRWCAVLHRDVQAVLAKNWKRITLTRERIETNWEQGVGQKLELTGHEHAVSCININQTTAVTASRDTTLRVWQLPDGKCQVTLRGHTAFIRCLQSDNYRALSGSADRTLRFWNLQRGECVATMVGHDASIWCLGYNEHVAVSGSADSRIGVFDLQTGNTRCMFNAHHGPVCSLEVCGGHMVASGGIDKEVRLWDTRAALQHQGAPNPVTRFIGHNGRIQTIDSDIDSHRILSVSPYGHEFILWDDRRPNMPVFSVQSPGAFAFHSRLDLDLVAMGMEDNSIQLWNLNTQEVQSTFQGHTDNITCLKFDRRRLVSASKDGTVRVWNPTDGQAISRIPVNVGYVTDLDFKETHLACAVFGRNVRARALLFNYALPAAKEASCASCFSFGRRRLSTSDFAQAL